MAALHATHTSINPKVSSPRTDRTTLRDLTLPLSIKFELLFLSARKMRYPPRQEQSAFLLNDPSEYTMIFNDSKYNCRNVSSLCSDPFTYLIRLFRTFTFSPLNFLAVVCDRILNPARISSFVLVSHGNLCFIVRNDLKFEPLGCTQSYFAY